MIMLDRPHGAPQPYRRPETASQTLGHPLVTPCHPPARPALEPGGDIGDRRGGEDLGVDAVRDHEAGHICGERSRGAVPARNHLGEGCARRSRGSGASHDSGAPGHVLVCGQPRTARFPLVIGHGHVRELQAELGHHRPHHVVAVQHELAAPLDDTARVTGSQFPGPDAPADTVPRLQDDYLVAGLCYPVRRQQASEPSPHHHDPHVRSRPPPAHPATSCHAPAMLEERSQAAPQRAGLSWLASIPARRCGAAGRLVRPSRGDSRRSYR